MPPPLGGSSGGLPSRVEYLSPQGVLLPRVYGTIASPLWLELRGPASWQVTHSWTECWLACHCLLPWRRMTFAWSQMQPGQARASGLGVLLLALVRWVGWVAPVCPTPGVWFVVPCPFAAALCCVCGVLGHLAPVHRCARSVR